jgi:hypothetical protein
LCKTGNAVNAASESLFVVSCKIFNPLKPSGNYMFHLLRHSVTLHFVFMGFVCSMSPTLFNIFIDEVIRQWRDVLIKDFKNTVLNTVLFADDQAILVNQRPAF